MLFLAACALAVLTLALAWRYSPLPELATAERIRGVLVEVREAPWAIIVVVAIFVLGAVVVVPVNMLVLVTAAVFGPWLGILYGGAGTVVSGVAMFLVGAVVGREALERLAGERFRRPLSILRRQGFLTVLTFRLLPVVPFTLINLAAGATGIRFIDFVAGTSIGMIPGLILLSILGDRIVAIVTEPSAGDIVILVLCIAALVGLTAAVRAVVSRRAGRKSSSE